MKLSRILQCLGGFVLAGGGMWVFLKKVDMSSLGQEISRTKPMVIMVCVVLSMLSLWFRALRWRVLLPSGPLPLHKKGLFPVVTIAFMVNNILPARLGEAARVLLLWKRNGYSIATSVGSLVLERGIDILVFSSFFFLPILLSENIRERLQGLTAFEHRALLLVAALAALFFCGALLVFLIYHLFPDRLRAVGRRLNALLPIKVQGVGSKVGSELISNLNWAFSKVKVAKVVVLSYLIAFCYSFMLVFLANEFKSFGVLESMFGQAFAAFGSAIPLAPGFVGTLHAVLRQGLTYLGVDAGRVGAMVILYHALSYLTVTAVGLFFLLGMNITFKDITRADEQIKKSSLKE